MEAPSPRTLGSHLPATLQEDTKGSEVTPMSASGLHPAHTGPLTEMKNPWACQVSCGNSSSTKVLFRRHRPSWGCQESHCKGQEGGPRLWVWCSAVAQ